MAVTFPGLLAGSQLRVRGPTWPWKRQRGHGKGTWELEAGQAMLPGPPRELVASVCAFGDGNEGYGAGDPWSRLLCPRVGLPQDLGRPGP